MLYHEVTYLASHPCADSLNLLVIVEFDRFPSSWPSEYAADAFRYFNAVCMCIVRLGSSPLHVW